MDYVYICKSGENEELRYSIRSVVKNAPEGRVWVVGGKPDWYAGDYIHVPQGPVTYSNARSILNTIINSNLISDDFVLMNDDFFVMQKIKTIPVLHGGSLKEKAAHRNSIAPTAQYTQLLNETVHTLKKFKINDPLDYELHIPMKMNKEKLRLALRYPGLWRSLYGNLHSIGGSQQDDVKIYGGKILNPVPVDIDKSIFLSTDDLSFNGVSKIKDSFKKKTRLEL